MGAMPAGLFRPGSLRLRIGVVPDPDNRYCAAVVPTSLPEATDYDMAWIQGMPVRLAQAAQQYGRANQVSRAASAAAGWRRAVDEAVDDCTIIQVLVSGWVTVRSGARPDVVSNGYVLQVKSPWDALNAAVADPSGSDDPAFASGEAEVGARWQALLASSSGSFVEAAPISGVTVEPTAARPWMFLHASADEFVSSFLVTVQDEELIQDYLEGLRRLIDSVVDVLCLVLVVVLAALSRGPRAPTFLLVMLATIRHYGHRGEPDGHFLPARAVHLCTSRGAACLVT